MSADAFIRFANRLPKEASPDKNYRLLSSLYQDIAKKIQDKPGVIQAEQIGRTVQNRAIWAFRIQHPMHPPKKRILIFAGLHALEWIGMETAVLAIEEMVDHPIPNIEAVIVPVVNVDRRLLTETDRKSGRKRYRRANANNVDLNRDYAVNRDSTAIWRKVIPDYYTQSTAPLSQPESQAIDRLAASAEFEYAISLHSFGGYIFYPWAGLYGPTTDHRAFQEIGRFLEGAQTGRYPYKSMQLTHWWFMFRAQGSEIDHLYGKYGIKAFLIELTRTGLSLKNWRDYKDPFRWYNPKEPQKDIQRGLDMILGLSRKMGKSVK